MYSHVRDLEPIPMNQAPSNTPILTTLHISLRQTVQELWFDQVLTHYTRTDTWRTRVQPRERPGTHPNESGTIKYPHFDYLHVSLRQTVQELQLDRVLTLYTCTNTLRTSVQPRERPGTHPNESGTIKYPHCDYLYVSLRQMVQELEPNLT